MINKIRVSVEILQRAESDEIKKRFALHKYLSKVQHQFRI